MRHDEDGKEFKQWESVDSPGGDSSVRKMILLPFVFVLSSFGLGGFSFLHQYSSTGIGHNGLIAVICNLIWSIPFLFLIRMFVREPYVRLAFYSFVSPSIFYGLHMACGIMIIPK